MLFEMTSTFVCWAIMPVAAIPSTFNAFSLCSHCGVDLTVGTEECFDSYTARGNDSSGVCSPRHLIVPFVRPARRASQALIVKRSEELRVGKGCGSTVSYRW